MFNFGVDYYPEHWPRERWETDARLMAEAGFNVVRMAEFAWVKMEPADGQFDFSWLDEAIAVLTTQGIRVILGTPTASPPAWLMTKYPDVFRVREDSVRVTYGNRREYCANNPTYRRYSQRIVTKMAEHYADNPAVIGWQIDNEFGERCYCPVCRQAFQTWLCERYKSLNELNEAWGTIFWSHTYTEWDQIPVPLNTGHSPNPGLALEFYRFSSESYVDYQQLQIDVLREKCPTHFITHNLMGFGYDRLNYFDLARPLDFVSWDNYRRMQWAMQDQVDPGRAALDHDTMRGLKRQNFWVMEQQAGSGGWEIVSVAPRPGELRLWAYQSIAHGADGIVFFRWRTARYGTEQYWHGLLDHDAYPSRRYQEIKGMGAEIRKFGDQILGAHVKANVAMMLSYDSRFAFQIQANNPEFKYPVHFYELYRAFHNEHVSIDVVSPDDALSGYKLVIVPALHVLSLKTAENLARFVEAGGTVVVGARSGVKDETNTVVNMRLPGLLAKLCGTVVEEYDSPAPGMTQALRFTTPDLSSASGNTFAWCDILAPDGAQVIARYTTGHYADTPAITLNHVGQGNAVYIGTMGDAGLHRSLAKWLLKLAGVQAIIETTANVEVAERWHGANRLLFILNHTDQPQEVKLNRRYQTLLDGKTYDSGVTVPAKDLVILTE